MIKFGLAFVVLSLFGNSSFSQTLFTYGQKAVTKDEFIRAFNKNPTELKERNKALKEYLDLYINFKLKVQAAYDAGLDKDATQQFELQNFKKQIADNIINEEANVKALVQQSFERSRKEIYLQQVFIETPQNRDTTESYKKIQQAFSQLKEGKEFSVVAQDFSSDEATKTSKGDIGFVTVFTLPFEIENIIYGLKEKSFSSPYKSKVGYHIFKNVAERKSSGSRKVAQILVAVPLHATLDEKKIASGKADSLYNLLINGADFSSVAAINSNDASSSANGGELPEFSIGAYNSTFEEAAFSLKKKGEMSRPFQTDFGYHILMLLEAKPAVENLSDPYVYAAMQDKVIKDNRLESARKELIQKKLSLFKFKSTIIKDKELLGFTNNTLGNTTTPHSAAISPNTVLFSLGSQNVKAAEWIQFVKAGSITLNNTNFSTVYNDFIVFKAEEFYRNNLHLYNSDFSLQLKEFKEANLLFGIMEKHVWAKANSDTANLLKYFNAHKANYLWSPSADAIIITCNNEKLVKQMQVKLTDNLEGWRGLVASNGINISADSGRYELNQLTVAGRTHFTPALMTTPVKNENDGTFTFNYIIKVYNEPAQRTFDDARGLVITNYQQVLEDKWITDLKKKYPVKVIEAVAKSIK